MGGSKKIKVSPKKLVSLLVQHRGNKSAVADALDVHRDTLQRMILDKPEIAKEFKAEMERRVDTVEDAVYLLAVGIPKMELIEFPDGTKEMIQVGWNVPPDPRAAKMLLDAKAKDRGYGKQELTLSTTEPIAVTVVNRIIKRESISEGKAEVID